MKRFFVLLHIVSPSLKWTCSCRIFIHTETLTGILKNSLTRVRLRRFRNLLTLPTWVFMLEQENSWQSAHGYWCPAQKLWNWELPRGPISWESLTWWGQNLWIWRARGMLHYSVCWEGASVQSFFREVVSRLAQGFRHKYTSRGPFRRGSDKL